MAVRIYVPYISQGLTAVFNSFFRVRSDVSLLSLFLRYSSSTHKQLAMILTEESLKCWRYAAGTLDKRDIP